MSRAIDADALIKQLYAQADDEGWWVTTAEDLEAFVNSMPTIEPERKKGKWVWSGYEVDDDEIMFCSECNHTIYPYQQSAFCPNCGAEMEGEEDATD